MIFGRCFVDCWPEHGKPARKIQATMTVASATRNQTIHPCILSPTPQTSGLRFSAFFPRTKHRKKLRRGFYRFYRTFGTFLQCPPKLLNPNSARMKARIEPVAQAIPQQVQT